MTFETKFKQFDWKDFYSENNISVFKELVKKPYISLVDLWNQLFPRTIKLPNENRSCDPHEETSLENLIYLLQEEVNSWQKFDDFYIQSSLSELFFNENKKKLKITIEILLKPKQAISFLKKHKLIPGEVDYLLDYTPPKLLNFSDLKDTYKLKNKNEEDIKQDMLSNRLGLHIKILEPFIQNTRKSFAELANQQQIYGSSFNLKKHRGLERLCIEESESNLSVQKLLQNGKLPFYWNVCNKEGQIIDQIALNNIVQGNGEDKAHFTREINNLYAEYYKKDIFTFDDIFFLQEEALSILEPINSEMMSKALAVAGKAGAEKINRKFKENREKAITIAKEYWETHPHAIKQDVINHVEKKLNYSVVSSTIDEWIKPATPTHKKRGGRPRK